MATYVAYYTVTNTIGVGIVKIENEHIYYEMATQTKRRTHKRRIYFNVEGDPFVDFPFGRIYLDEIMRCF